MVVQPEEILKLVLAVLVGGLIGAEREFRDKAAGFRTMILICVGAALFTIFSARFASDRVASNIATGVGFIGAGVIMRETGRVTGLTTAAAIWLTAALGLGLGLGSYLFVFITTVVIMVVFWFFPPLEEQIKRAREDRLYEVTCSLRPEKAAELRALLRQNGLHPKGEKEAKVAGCLRWTCDAYGSPVAHGRFVQALFADSEVHEFRY